MKEEKKMHSIDNLVSTLDETNNYFRSQVQKQVNVALTLRNWLFGLYIVEYELNGADRAVYGQKLFKEIAKRAKHIKGLSESNLYVYRQFYQIYPQIFQTVSGKFQYSDFKGVAIFQSVTGKLEAQENVVSQSSLAQVQTDPNILINKLSFTHIIELLKVDNLLNRTFYEVEAIKNNWSVRELQRAMNSMLFERTGLSTDKQAVLEKHKNTEEVKPEDIFRNPYLLEFLGLEEKSEYSENDLEQAIINHLQSFLLEMGRGFCFESRQKRITFDNTHFKIDLVFYHRILKCHVLIDLKLGEFSHADSGQMNVYLNYFRENEMHEGDNPPIGIILCANKNENLVKYATANLPQQVFVSKYLINLPSEKELEKIIEEEQNKLVE
jgi:predicted nuclease of restriction endonuclease-like (RecB) superfamily